MKKFRSIGEYTKEELYHELQRERAISAPNASARRSLTSKISSGCRAVRMVAEMLQFRLVTLPRRKTKDPIINH